MSVAHKTLSCKLAVLAHPCKMKAVVVLICMAVFTAVLATDERNKEHEVSLQTRDSMLLEERRHRVHRGRYRHGRSIEDDIDTLESRRHRYRKGRSLESVEDQQVEQSKRRRYHYRRGRSVDSNNEQDQHVEESKRRRYHYRRGRSIAGDDESHNVQDMDPQESRKRYRYRKGRSVA